MWLLDYNIDKQEPWAYAPNVFTKDQCEKIIKIGELLNLEEAKTGYGDENKPKNEKYRDSKISWILPSQESEWLFRHMTDVVNHFNSKYFNYDLYGFGEGLQFTKYEAPSGNYKPHIDKMYNGVVRKLSVVVQLSNSNDYEGGGLFIQNSSGEFIQMKKEQGFCVVFPSHTLHVVKPVTKGLRYSLVSWITGPNLR